MRTLLVTAAVAAILGLADVSAHAQPICDIHHLGYTKTECGMCFNMTWSVTKYFPRGVCVSNGRFPFAMPTASCTPTPWRGATLPLNAPNFSTTGVRISVCRNGYNLGMSQLKCSTGFPATAINSPTTNVTCSSTTAVGGNPQVTINGIPCCLP